MVLGLKESRKYFKTIDTLLSYLQESAINSGWYFQIVMPLILNDGR